VLSSACPGPCDGVPATAGGAPEADGIPSDEPRGTRCVLILTPMIIVAAATVVFGIYPDPLVDWAANAGESLGSVL
jgi:hypothetical protein